MVLMADSLVEIEGYLAAYVAGLPGMEKDNMREKRSIAKKMLYFASGDQERRGPFTESILPRLSAEALGVFGLEQLIALEQQIAQLRFQFYPLAQIKQRPSLTRDELAALGIKVQEASESRWGDAHEKIKRAWVDHQCARQESILLQHPNLTAYRPVSIASLMKAWQAVCMIGQLQTQLLDQYQQHRKTARPTESSHAEFGQGYRLANEEQAAGLLQTLTDERQAAQYYLLELLYQYCQMIHAIGLTEESLLSFHYKRLSPADRSGLEAGLKEHAVLIAGSVLFKPLAMMTHRALKDLIALIAYIKNNCVLTHEETTQLNQIVQIPWVSHYLADRFLFSYADFHIDIAIPSTLAWPHWLFRGSYVRHQLFFQQSNSLYLELIRNKLDSPAAEVSTELSWVLQEMQRVRLYQAMLWPWFFSDTSSTLQVYWTLLAHLKTRLLAYSVQSFQARYRVPSPPERKAEASLDIAVETASLTGLEKEKQTLLSRIVASGVNLDRQAHYQVQVNRIANAYIHYSRGQLACRLILESKASSTLMIESREEALLSHWQFDLNSGLYEMMRALVEKRYAFLEPDKLLTEIQLFFLGVKGDGLLLAESAEDRLIQIEQAFFTVYWLPFIYAYDGPARSAFDRFEAYVHQHLDSLRFRSRLAYIGLIKSHRDHHNERLILVLKSALTQGAFSTLALKQVVEPLSLETDFPDLSWPSLHAELIQLQHPGVPALLSHYVAEKVGGADGLHGLIEALCAPEVFATYIEKYFLHCLREGIGSLLAEEVLLQYRPVVQASTPLQTVLNDRLTQLTGRLDEVTQGGLSEAVEALIDFRLIAQAYLVDFDPELLVAILRAVLLRFPAWRGWQRYVLMQQSEHFNPHYQAWVHHLYSQVILGLLIRAAGQPDCLQVASIDSLSLMQEILRDSIINNKATRDLYAVLVEQQIPLLSEGVRSTGVVNLLGHRWLDFVLSDPGSADCHTLSTERRAQWSEIVKAQAAQAVRIQEVNQLICAINGNFFENLSESFDRVLVSAMPEALKTSIVFAGLYYLSSAVTSRLANNQFQAKHVMPIRTVLLSIKVWYQSPPGFLVSLIQWFDAVVQCTTQAAIRQSCQSFEFGLGFPELQAQCLASLSLFHSLPNAISTTGRGDRIALSISHALDCDMSLSTEELRAVDANLIRYRQRIEDKSGLCSNSALSKACYQSYPLGTPAFHYFFYRVLMLYLDYEQAGRLDYIAQIKMSLPALGQTYFSIMNYPLSIREGGQIIDSMRTAVKTDIKAQRLSSKRYHNPALSFLLAHRAEALDFLYKILALQINTVWTAKNARAWLKKYMPMLRVLLMRSCLSVHFSQHDINAAKSNLSLIAAQMVRFGRSDVRSLKAPNAAVGISDQAPAVICH